MFELKVNENIDHEIVVKLSGNFDLDNIETINTELNKSLFGKELHNKKLVINGEELERIETGVAKVLLNTLNKQMNSEIKFLGFNKSSESIIKLVSTYSKNTDYKELKEDSFFVLIGKSTYLLYKALYIILTFIGETFVSLLQLFLNPKKLRVKELAVQLEATGINAIPIVTLVTFLIGVVVAYLTAEQIKKFGANILIVDAISIAMCRELSPVLVAIIVAGRSGSAFTSQLGAMKLNEEVDAISVLGLSPMQVLILPRVIALMLVMPMLVFVGDISGIVGGMLVGEFYLGLSGATFIERLQSALAIKHVVIGLIKAPVFAYFIAVIGCHLGLQVTGSAKDLGEMTTSTVVRSIVLVILLNAVFAVLFSQMGI